MPNLGKAVGSLGSTGIWSTPGEMHPLRTDSTSALVDLGLLEHRRHLGIRTVSAVLRGAGCSELVVANDKAIAESTTGTVRATSERGS